MKIPSFFKYLHFKNGTFTLFYYRIFDKLNLAKFKNSVYGIQSHLKSASEGKKDLIISNQGLWRTLFSCGLKQPGFELCTASDTAWLVMSLRFLFRFVESSKLWSWTRRPAMKRINDTWWHDQVIGPCVSWAENGVPADVLIEKMFN